jgi:hypothetical protein
MLDAACWLLHAPRPRGQPGVTAAAIKHHQGPNLGRRSRSASPRALMTKIRQTSRGDATRKGAAKRQMSRLVVHKQWRWPAAGRAAAWRRGRSKPSERRLECLCWAKVWHCPVLSGCEPREAVPPGVCSAPEQFIEPCLKEHVSKSARQHGSTAVQQYGQMASANVKHDVITTLG